MAFRVTAAEVRSVVGGGGLPDAVNVDLFIESANSHINSVCLPHYDVIDSAGTEDDEEVARNVSALRMAELWLAAHYLASTYPDLKRERIGDAEEEYQVIKLDANLTSTSYGMRAMQVEYKGYLAAQNNAIPKVMSNLPARLKLGVGWLGKDLNTTPRGGRYR